MESSAKGKDYWKILSHIGYAAWSLLTDVTQQFCSKKKLVFWQRQTSSLYFSGAIVLIPSKLGNNSLSLFPFLLLSLLFRPIEILWLLFFFQKKMQGLGWHWEQSPESVRIATGQDCKNTIHVEIYSKPPWLHRILLSPFPHGVCLQGLCRLTRVRKLFIIVHSKSTLLFSILPMFFFYMRKIRLRINSHIITQSYKRDCSEEDL